MTCPFFYLREVKRGGEVEILDRGLPVARLSRVEPDSESTQERRARLVENGVLRAGSGKAAAVLDQDLVEVRSSILAALVEERADRL